MLVGTRLQPGSGSRTCPGPPTRGGCPGEGSAGAGCLVATVTHLQAAAAAVTSCEKTFAACWYFRAPISVSGWLHINSLSIWLTDQKKPKRDFVQQFLSQLSRETRGTQASGNLWGHGGSRQLAASTRLSHHPFTLVRAEPTLRHRGDRWRPPASLARGQRRLPAGRQRPALRRGCCLKMALRREAGGARRALGHAVRAPRASAGRRVCAALRPPGRSPPSAAKRRPGPFPPAEAWRGREILPRRRGGAGRFRRAGRGVAAARAEGSRECGAGWAGPGWAGPGECPGRPARPI